MRPLLLLASLLALLALPLTACARLGFEDGLNLGVSMPASQADLGELRDWVDAQDAAIRTDFAAADEAGRTAYDEAIAAGLTEAEARAKEAEARAGAAAAAAQASTDRAAEAAAKAEDGGVGLEEILLTLIMVASGVFGLNLHRNKTRAAVLANGNGHTPAPASTP